MDWSAFPQVYDLKQLGCADWSRTVSATEIKNASVEAEFSYAAALFPSLMFGLGITLVVSLAVYALVRAIGWVIGGFVA
jgi:predicted Co/Zn/Cd cation transporter (cation efflux family)